MERLLKILNEESPSEEALVEALEDLQELHEYDIQWVNWPQTIADSRRTPYKRGLFRAMCGILRCVERGQGAVQGVAVDLLHSLVVGGCNLTRVPPGFVVECGAIGALCRAARETNDMTVLQILTQVSRMVRPNMLPSLIDGGAVESAIEVLNTADSAPLEQLAALDLILSLAKRAPARTAKAGAYEAVLGVDNPALVPRRNKIMNFLRPLVQHETGENAPLTNLRVGGLKF